VGAGSPQQFGGFLGEGWGAQLFAAALGRSWRVNQLGDFLGAPEFDQRLVGHIQAARVTADGIQNILGHAQRDRLGGRAQLGKGRQFGLAPIDILRAVVFGDSQKARSSASLLNLGMGF